MSGTWNHLREVWGPPHCNPRHTSQDSGLLQLPRALRGRERVHAHETPPGKLIKSTDYQQWRCQSSFHQTLRTMNVGGEHKTRVRYTCGTPWTTRTDGTRWKLSIHRTTGWYGKRRIMTGHVSYGRQPLSRYSLLTKIQKRASGVTKLKDGGEEAPRVWDIKVTKCKKIVECWVKSQVKSPKAAQAVIKSVLMAPQQSYGKDSYTIDLAGSERTYWLGTESGLSEDFHFDGACTAGDGSCDVASLSMGAGFCNISSLQWLTSKTLTPTSLQNQRTKQSYKVGREKEGMSSNRPELVVLWGCLEAHPDHENLLYLPHGQRGYSTDRQQMDRRSKTLSV